MSNLNELINKGMVKLVEPKQTNADKIRSLNDEELGKFLSETTNCEFCKVQCDDRHSLPTVDSCKYRFKEWLQSEVLE